MAEAKHTPGPWHWVDGYRLEPMVQDYKAQAVSSILDREGGCGYVGRKNDETLAELEADFALIAASPDLLDAARAAEAVLGRQKWLAGSTDPEAVALFKLRAAIAKADRA